jgi:hypothetical protein
MGKIVRLGFALLLLANCQGAFAQWYGVKAGNNQSKILYFDKEGVKSDAFTANSGYHLGMMGGFRIFRTLSMETGFLFSEKGYEKSSNTTIQGEAYDIKTVGTFNYAEIPVTVKASFKAGKAKVFGAVGPYIGFGAGGEYESARTSVETGRTSTYFRNYQWGSDVKTDSYKMLDLGLNLGTGIDFKKIQMSVTYGMGFRNITEIPENNGKVYNRVLGLTMVYKLDCGDLQSPDYLSRLRAVRRISKQSKLMKVCLYDTLWTVRKAAFIKLKESSLIDICKITSDSAIIIGAKIRLGNTSWKKELDKATRNPGQLGNVLGAVALVDSPEPESIDVVTACHHFIRQGDSSRIPELINLLNRFGNITLAEDYLNCGQPVLYTAGESWLQAHGMGVKKGPGSNRVQWGEGKRN